MAKIYFYAQDDLQDCIPEPYLYAKNVPDWFTKTEKGGNSKCPWITFKDYVFGDANKKTTIRTCPGLIDHFSQGYIIPSWNNFLFRGDYENGLIVNWETLDDRTEYSFHSCEDQVNGMKGNEMPKYGGYHKLDSPWYVKTDPGYSILICHPYWYREDRFTTVSGIMHCDTIPMPVKWFFEWHKDMGGVENYGEFNYIKKGHPLVFMMPFKRSKIEKKVNYVSREEMNKHAARNIHYAKDWFQQSQYFYHRKNIGRLFTP